MNSNVKILPGAPIPEGQPVQVTVDFLQELLDAARRGEVRSVAACWTDCTQVVFTKWAHNAEFFKLQGAAAQLLHRMCE